MAQIGARRSYAVARGFAATGCLEQLVTDACALNRPWVCVDRIVPPALRPPLLRQVLNRRPEGLEAARIRGSLSTLIGTRFGGMRRPGGEAQVQRWVRQNRLFGSAVSKAGWGRANAVYAFNGAAFEVFERARRSGILCVLDQTAAPWRFNTALLAREQSRWPGWEQSPVDADLDGDMIAREEAEWQLADRIVCGSEFVVDAIRAVGGPAEKCVVVRYPLAATPQRRGVTTSGSRPLRVLFVGTLQLRKGIQYVWDLAGRLSGRVEFRAVGPSHLTPSAERELCSRIQWKGAVPRAEVSKHHRWADVFVLPTLSEGSANACWEALSAGIPVVTTRASGVEGVGLRFVQAETGELESALMSAAPRGDCSESVLPRSIGEYGADLVAAFA